MMECTETTASVLVVTDDANKIKKKHVYAMWFLKVRQKSATVHTDQHKLDIHAW